jgi:hypothetical protein
MAEFFNGIPYSVEELASELLTGSAAGSGGTQP